MRLQTILASAMLSGMTVCAQAQQCGPLREIAALDTTRLPDSQILTVNAMINGKSTPMMVQTGGFISRLRESALPGLGMSGVSNSNVITLKGRKQSSESFAQSDSFTLGAIRVARMQFQVPPGTAEDKPWAGVLASDLFSQYDLEVDPAGQKIRLFDKNHCPGRVIYWNTAAIAVLPFQEQLPTADASRTGFATYFNRGTGVYVQVDLDGKELTASVDTGSEMSSMSAGMAKFLFGVTAESPGSTPQPSPDDNPRHAPYLHVFPTLTFDTVTVKNANIMVYPDNDDVAMSDYMKRTDTRLLRNKSYFVEHMDIGMNILRRLRLYIAYGERKVYITPGSAPPPAATTPVAAPAATPAITAP